ncbi:hypothetical protein FTO60_05200 [Octadecabacter sp. SW4]|uniref:hypothetical protein n=1 Tax=Octadecabacter sp. SW4 TaxID=2602067 RepID=UPI0011C1E7CA|nr:hypothetical protein [Octadecabacter sp. SW4]QEE35162.1 hypothetical protein FTO60_05200 [Octadecabacter sp. SW4]
MKFLIVLVSLLALSGCRDDGFLSKQELETIFAVNAVCGDVETTLDGSCAWGEAYNQFGNESVFALFANPVGDYEHRVVLVQMIWDGDFLCMQNSAAGIREIYSGPTLAFRFDRSNVRRVTDGVFQQMLPLFAREQANDTCYRYAWRDEDQTHLIRTKFVEGNQQPTTKQMLLVPLSAGGLGLAGP